MPADALGGAAGVGRPSGGRFDLQPVLEGELITLRPLRADDFDALYAVAADPRIWEQHPASDRHDRAVFQRFFDEALAGGGAFVIIDRADGSVIGSSRYHGASAERDEVEVGWTFLARSHWGGRYNGEVKQLMLAHAFRFVGRAVFIVGSGNVRSQRAMARVGGVRAGVREDGGGRQSFIYEIRAPTADDPPAGPSPGSRVHD